MHGGTLTPRHRAPTRGWSSARPTNREALAVVVHDQLLILGRESSLGEIGDERERIGQTFGMRPIGTQHQSVRTERVAKEVEVVLVERRHRDVALEIDGVWL